MIQPPPRGRDSARWLCFALEMPTEPHRDFHGGTAIPPWVPRRIRGELDASELLAGASGELRRERRALERTLGHHVALYRCRAVARPNGLCSFYAPAELDRAGLEQLRRAEKRWPLVVFVVYRKPLRGLRPTRRRAE